MEMNKELAAWEENRQYVIENQESLRELYGDKYISVVDKKIVDSDKDELGLTKRMYEKFQDKSVFIFTIEDAVNPKSFALESPEGTS